MSKSPESLNSDATNVPGDITVSLDFDSCYTSGECLFHAPGVFGIASDGSANVMVDGKPSDNRKDGFAVPLPANQLEAAQYAAYMCPGGAIRINLPS